MMPRRASGSVMVMNTRSRVAPRVVATCSRRGLTASKAIRAPRTSKGKDMTAIAATTALQVKTISRSKYSWRKAPMGLFRPRTLSKIRPVATGGITSGSATSVSTADFPGHDLRARSQAKPTPNGRIAKVANKAIANVKRTISHSADLMGEPLLPDDEAELLENRQGWLGFQILEKSLGGTSICGALHNGNWIRNLRTFAGRHFIGNLDRLRNGCVGLINDAGLDIAGLDSGQSRADIFCRHNLGLDRIPES